MKVKWIVVCLCLASAMFCSAGLRAEETNAPSATTPPVSTEAAPAPAPAPAPVPATDDESVYNFSDLELNLVLTTLAKRAGLSVIVGDGVVGKVTVHLENVPPKDAMRMIVDSKGFVMQEEKGIVKISTREAAENQPLEVRIYTLKYAKAEDIKSVLNEVKGPKGRIQADARSNTLVISDTPTYLEKIMPVVEGLDAQTTQVMIEAKFIETTKNPHKDLGINWSDTLKSHRVSIGGKPTAEGGEASTGPFTLGPVGSLNNAGSWLGGSFAVLDAGQASVTLSFLNADKNTDLLANPRVVTTDNGKARINITQQYPIPTFTFSESTASFQLNGFQYKDIGIILNVVPRINRDNFITLEVAPEVSDYNESKTFASDSATFDVPIINTRNVTTTVIIKSGNTLAMGGLIREDTSDSYTKVPIMGDLPLFGPLFRSKSLDRIKRNLLVFLTPTVVDPAAANATGFEKHANGFPEEETFVNDKWMPKDNAKPRDLMKEMKKSSTNDKLRTGKTTTQNFGSK